MRSAFESVPGHWRASRLDRVATVHARIGWKALIAAEYQPDGYAFLATPNIKNGEIDFQNVNYISEFRYKESPELQLTEGDVLLAKDGNTLGIVNVVKELPRPSTVNGSIAVIRPSEVHPNFLKYVLASHVTQALIGSLKDGMGVPHLFQWDIRRLPIPLPPPEEQRRIANFLDAETASVDTIIRARRSQADLLEEFWNSRLASRTQALISQHGIVPLRRLARSVEQGWSPQCDDVVASPQDWAVLKTSAVSTGEFDPIQHKLLPDRYKPDLRYQVSNGDVLMTRGSGSPSHVGVAAVAQTAGRKLLLSDLIYRINLDDRLVPEFAVLAINSQVVRSSTTLLFRGQSGQTIKLRAADVKSINIPAVPVTEQRKWAATLEFERGAIRNASAAIAKSSVLLSERRRALITAAVTGEFDVSTASGRGLSG